MKVRVRVHNAAVRMPVRVDQVSSQQQVVIRQDLRRRGAGGNSSSIQHQNAFGDILHNL